ncbi:unnamed protein product [Symbiodinium natans]|uniref:Uncharacterized protein n=1 Tax=Symbiodinium natans TaxID=878477 RepID=A0A812RIH4_9DINO|nr:unnamed protein product [Symbiodinium natans]
MPTGTAKVATGANGADGSHEVQVVKPASAEEVEALLWTRFLFFLLRFSRITLQAFVFQNKRWLPDDAEKVR